MPRRLFSQLKDLLESHQDIDDEDLLLQRLREICTDSEAGEQEQETGM